ncbi:GTP 3',8-cyclase MoaA [Allokutzneria sp. A3M-2-11 16]|uniref:GTP 3',8-cyclase MoaA n=1 Tax=Allokutzneria sp. A3M-2-11 16 TaxID=2962043 RepID=UPI0020B7D031|nr:GTP 3',8-cyclase MoaA [Allokutzneria sp. A3M-2-11 16]MCP3800098.1 GTP 3',8-cyclase MoaA [Allokutzneria sp. A3M-2-11 16]
MPSVPRAAEESTRPDERALIDRFGRIATDLRVSVTDRCNLRCSYCMPAEGLDWLPGADLLSGAELSRLIAIAVRELGVTEIRFTGGEPLLRKDIIDVIGAAAQLDPRPRMSLTTNGLRLPELAGALEAAGLDRVNVSLDTLRADRFFTITRRNRLDKVLDGMAAAAAAGLTPVKVNAVLMRGVNEDEAVPLLEYCLDQGYELRFIEQMPLDPQHAWDRDRMVTAAEILDMLGAAFELTPHPAPRGGAPAERWVVDGGRGSVGVIASVTQPFCAACDRTRLTADGQIRSCLFARTETDLRGPLREGADDAAISALWRNAMWGKAAGHGIDDAGFAQPDRPMSAIGG